MTISPVHVIGAGLAGCEAVTQLTRHGIPVILHEMRPVKSDGAHKTAYFAELVCSNSLRAANIENAVGLLKEEMRRLGSLIMECADTTRVPAGGALAVDREGFSRLVTEKIKNCEKPYTKFYSFSQLVTRHGWFTVYVIPVCFSTMKYPICMFSFWIFIAVDNKRI